MKWRTKPKIKEADQFFIGKPLPFASDNACCLGPNGWYVVTAHGQEMTIVEGDYIVRESDGRGFYPCKPDIWEASHDAYKAGIILVNGKPHSTDKDSVSYEDVVQFAEMTGNPSMTWARKGTWEGGILHARQSVMLSGDEYFSVAHTGNA